VVLFEWFWCEVVKGRSADNGPEEVDDKVVSERRGRRDKRSVHRRQIMCAMFEEADWKLPTTMELIKDCSCEVIAQTSRDTDLYHRSRSSSPTLGNAFYNYSLGYDILGSMKATKLLSTAIHTLNVFGTKCRSLCLLKAEL